jgi:alkylation response protein AidB-like acyl-CoA dehydrogenase
MLPVELPGGSQLTAFRTEIRDWLALNLPADLKVPPLRDPTGASGAEFTKRLRWQSILHTGGWAAVHWPTEYGGRGAGLVEHAVFLAECAEAHAPEPANVIGLSMVGPTLIEHGTKAQPACLPLILSGEQMWCQLYSEPDAGSDLGMIRTAATRVNGGWSVSGQKIWCSWAAVADRGMLLARSAPGRLDGLTCFLIDMHAPGVDVRPMRQISGDEHFCEVFLDEVYVPDSQVVGEPGAGWTVATTTLTHERTTAIFARHGATIDAADQLAALLERGPVPEPLRDRAARLWSDAQLLRLTAYRGLSEIRSDNLPAALFIQRLAWGRTNKAVFDLAIDVISEPPLLDQVSPDERADWNKLFLASQGWTIGGGTSEIQRNMLASRVLRMARS